MESTYTSSSCLVTISMWVYVTRFAKMCIVRIFINIYKYHFEIFNSKYLESALRYLHAILHKSVVTQDNSVGLLLNGLLAELPAILQHYHK